MKKVFLILIPLVFLIGCTKPFKYDLDTLEEKVISAEIVKTRILEDSMEFDLVNKVEDDRLKDLFNDLSMIQFAYGGRPKTQTGFALKLNYTDGYELICNTYIAWYNNDGEPIKYKRIRVSPDDYNEFILKYKIPR